MKCDIAVINRIKRIHGQVGGILKMIEEERGCEDLIIQLKAVKNSVDTAMKLLTTTNLIDKIEKEYNIEIENIEKELDLIIKN